jgi:hypothetical protein
MATIIYGLHKNLPASSQFITNCTEVPTNTSGASYVECDENNRCFIKDGNNHMQDLYLRIAGLYFVALSTICI